MRKVIILCFIHLFLVSCSEPKEDTPHQQVSESKPENRKLSVSERIGAMNLPERPASNYITKIVKFSSPQQAISHGVRGKQSQEVVTEYTVKFEQWEKGKFVRNDLARYPVWVRNELADARWQHAQIIKRAQKKARELSARPEDKKKWRAKWEKETLPLLHELERKKEELSRNRYVPKVTEEQIQEFTIRVASENPVLEELDLVTIEHLLTEGKVNRLYSNTPLSVEDKKYLAMHRALIRYFPMSSTKGREMQILYRKSNLNQ